MFGLHLTLIKPKNKIFNYLMSMLIRSTLEFLTVFSLFSKSTLINNKSNTNNMHVVYVSIYG